MSQSEAQKVVLASVLVSGAIIVWTDIKGTGKATPTGKTLVSFALLAGVLAIGAEVAPGIAGPFAILVALSIAVSRISPGSTGGKISGLIPTFGKTS